MRNISSKQFKILTAKTMLFTGLLILSVPLFSAENNFGEISKNTEGQFQGISSASFGSLSFTPKRSAPAKVEAINISKIPAEISAKIIKITVKPGVVVKSGDIIAKLECGDYQARLATATAILNQSQQQLSYEEKELRRAIKVAHKSSLSKSEVERRQTVVNNLKFSIDANKANQTIAKQNVKRCTIAAPFTGLVSNRIANVGEMLAAGAPVVELVQLNHSEVSATISLSNLTSFNNATEFNFVTQGNAYPIKLRTLFNYVANNSSSQKARFVFMDETVTIGSTGRLEWKAPFQHLPAYLLSKRSGKDGVFIERDGIAVFIFVKDAEEGRPFMVDLLDQDKVVIDGRHGLQPNQKLIFKSNNIGNKD